MRLPKILWMLRLARHSARFKVLGQSMSPTLADGQSLLVVRPGSVENRFGRGDIVVLRPPGIPGAVYVKRIIGLPHEDLRLEGGRVYLKGQLLDEPYLQYLPYSNVSSGKSQSELSQEHNREWWLGPGEYFVLADDRGDSHDSRGFGPVSQERIIGRVWFRFWPPRAWHQSKEPSTQRTGAGKAKKPSEE